MRPNAQNPCIAWWSGGVTSAVACKLCIDWFGVDNTRVVFIDTKNEDNDTYRFKSDCEIWYGKTIETLTNEDYKNIQEVWYKSLSLNVANGAKCSSELKRKVRERFERINNYSCQAFGFDIDEINRAKAMQVNHAKSKPIFPLISNLLTKKDCINLIKSANDLFISLQLPRTYKLGYHNNNCFKTGCVQGGVGYWQKIQAEDIEKFNRMAKVEHELTDLKGEPVTMLKDQSKGGGLIFLLPHPNYPQIKDISHLKGKEVKPLFECNGFCGTNDLIKNETENEINYATRI